MRKQILRTCLFSFLCFTLVTQAQDLALNRQKSGERAPLMTTPDDSYPQAGFHFGIRFQPQITWIKSSAYDANSLKVNSSYGTGYAASLAYFFSNHFDVQLEAMYSSLEQKYHDRYDASRSIKLDYIHIPFLFALHTNYGKAFSFNVAVGPQLGLLTGSKSSGDYSASDTSHTTAILSAKPLDIGLAYGAGIDMGMGESRHVHLNIGLRGVKGLTTIENLNNGTLAKNQYYILDNSYANSIGAYIGLMFKL